MHCNQSNCSAGYSKINNSTSLGSVFGSPAYVVGMTVLYIIIISASLIGYGLVYLSVYLNPRLRTFCNWFILSLGLADVMTAGLVLPINVGFLLNTFRFTSVLECDFIASVNLISISAVALNLCAVSLERYFSISYPFRYEVFMNAPTMRVGLMSGIWFYAVVSGMLPQMGWRKHATQLVQGGNCMRDNTRSYTLFITVCNFFVPAVILIGSNALVYRIATGHAKRLFRNLHGNNNQNMAESLRKNYRAAKRISLIVGVYLICWFPPMTVLIIGLVIGARNIPLEVYPITLSLQYMSSAINPCLFCLTNKELRQTVMKTFYARVWLKRSPASIQLTSDEMSRNDRRQSEATRISQFSETSRM